MKELTKAEEQVMQVLWRLNGAFVKDVIDQLPEPKPAYNTISTIIRILEKKGFVDHESYGKTYRYFPVVSKRDYSKSYLRSVIQGYFGNSFRQMVSFFAREENLTLEEIEEIMQKVKEELNSTNNK
jgi:predicted transcriptional regulator